MGKVNTMPTKSIIIGMTKDTKLEDAIFEFIANSVNALDGKSKKGKYIIITFNKDKNTLIITDNCEGISKTDAINKAFRFGNKYDGENMGFGVGMKRALFKLADEFTVYSNTDKDCFEIYMDVNEWLSNEEDWSIDLLDDKKVSKNKGLTISISKVKQSIRRQLFSKAFKENLIKEIKERYWDVLIKGFEFRINDNEQIIINAKDVADNGKKIGDANLKLNGIHVNIIIKHVNKNIKEDESSVFFEYPEHIKINKKMVDFMETFNMDFYDKYDLSKIVLDIKIEGKDINKMPIRTDKSDIDMNDVSISIIVKEVKKLFIKLISDNRIQVKSEGTIEYREPKYKIRALADKYQINTKKYNAEVGRITFEECYKKSKS